MSVGESREFFSRKKSAEIILCSQIDDQFQVSHPLAKQDFRTNGVDLFIERYGELINASSGGKKELKEALNDHLESIEPDDSGLAIKLYPFTRSDEVDNPRLVVIDPSIAFGRLAIAGMSWHQGVKKVPDTMNVWCRPTTR